MMYDYTYADAYAPYGATSTASPLMSFVWLLMMVVILVGEVMIFKKAGRPWWAALIPIYNAYVLLQIVKKPGWWLLLLFVPFVNFIIAIILMFELSKAFGKSTGFALGLIFLPFVFLLILGFGSAKYVYGGAVAPKEVKTPEAVPAAK